MVIRTAMRPSTLIFQVEDDGKGWVWLAAEMSPGGLAVELFKSVPYGTLGRWHFCWAVGAAGWRFDLSVVWQAELELK